MDPRARVSRDPRRLLTVNDGSMAHQREAERDALVPEKKEVTENVQFNAMLPLLFGFGSTCPPPPRPLTALNMP